MKKLKVLSKTAVLLIAMMVLACGCTKKAEQPKEEPGVVTPAKEAVETPVTEAPAAEQNAAEMPVTEAPAVEEPASVPSLPEEIASFEDIMKLHSFYLAGADDCLDGTGMEEWISDGVCEVAGSFGNPFDEIKYARRDISGDGNPELIVAIKNEFDNSDSSRILAVYGMKDNKPVLLLDGWARKRVYLLEDNSLYEEGSSGAAYSGWVLYRLNTEGSELTVEKCVYSDTSDADNSKVFINTTGEWTYNDDELSDVTVEDAFAEGDAYLAGAVKLELEVFSGAGIE